jgi:hypothetical protein
LCFQELNSVIPIQAKKNYYLHIKYSETLANSNHCMADVRSMLRAERAARAPPKSRKQAQTAQPSRKRKADDDDDDDSDGGTRKRTRAEEVNDLPAGFFDGASAEVPAHEEDEPEPEPEPPLPGFVAAKEKDPQVVAQQTSVLDTAGAVPSNFFENKETPNIDDEWAAFEREVASVPAPRQTALDAIKTGAVISAAPLSAEELAAQAREDKKTQKINREEEIAAEKEDATRALEEEFDEMEALEERVKRLRDKREKLRESRQAGDVQRDAVPPVPHKDIDQESSENDDDEDDEWDGWRFGTS